MSPSSNQHPDVYDVHVLGQVRSSLKDLHDAPLQGHEGAPQAWLVFAERVRAALDGLSEGEEILVLTWLHLADRHLLRVHPRGDTRNPLKGVFGTRSPDRPNPIGLHRTRILEIDGTRVRVANLEAVDGTPIIDVKVVLSDDDR
jgi:tRNA-Thr(GGU) m(6)t(6)A37 methyltransferase TsaA